MKKVILVACTSFELSVAHSLMKSLAKQQIEVAIQENKKQLEEIRNVAFKPEPLEFINHRLEWSGPKLNDIHRNKFFDKPRHNFKKR